MGGREDDPGWRGDLTTHYEANRLGLCVKCHRRKVNGECPTCDNRALFDPVSREARK